MNTFVTSDLHFCHNKEFLYSPRGFSNINDMNETIVNNWNSIINYDDNVYVLGDLMLNNNNEGLNLIRRLNGNLFIVIGNHDTNERILLYKELYNVKDVQFGYRIRYKGQNLFLTHFPTITSNFDYDKPLKARTINICGHTHTQDKWVDWDNGLGLIYHAELDAHNNFPVNLDIVVEDIKNKFI